MQYIPMKTSAQRRKSNLMKEDPHCFYCRREVFIFPHVDGKRVPNNQATLDHIEDRVYRIDRPIIGENTVLACFKCNGERNRYRQMDPKAEIIWKRSLRPIQPWKAFLINLLFKVI